MTSPGEKVSLTKARPSVSLTKKTGAAGKMRVNLNWHAGAAKGLFKKSSAIDLDLACLFELQDGRKGAVQALGNAFGSIDAAPFVALDGDDRSGSSEGGENLTINLDHLDQIKRILVFAYIYEGTPNWAAAQAVVTMHPVGAAPVEIQLDETSTYKTVALALLENVNGELSIRRENRYIDGTQRALDEAYGWGMQWKAGHK
jgi:tellurite resistance protein TerA